MSGAQVVRTVLAQFTDAPITIQIFPKITQENQIEELLQRAVEQWAIVD